jgi:ribonuclease HI
MAALKRVTVYTDGACLRNPGPGGYGVVLLCQDRRRELSGGFRRTTNNRMELMAALVALQTLRFRCEVTVYTDSRYLSDGVSQGWAQRWVCNHDLWKKLLAECARHEVAFEWIRGHAGDPENEHCHRLASAAAQQEQLPADEGYERQKADADSLPLFEPDESDSALTGIRASAPPPPGGSGPGV